MNVLLSFDNLRKIVLIERIIFWIKTVLCLNCLPQVYRKMAGFILRNVCGRTLLQGQNSFAPLYGVRTVVLKVVRSDERPGESHDDRNARLKRPQSPHLTIYAPQLTSMLSITHRMTGMALAGYAAMLGLGALALPHDATHYLTMLEGLNAPTLMALKFTLAYPFSFHAVNGVRHLFWDMGKFLTIKEVYSTGYAMLLISGVLAAALTFL
ncbi:succinate dehydrogenase cytochrome b560 subunit, mitochondrial-like [Toxorhynchites rutilus septentrionalis]|uniref:succinate dehydrogenase cytochrome b560 subunit, mitochondrial-like n=1 Tax=Toxorhynchites rutilus septentrionalis TaxID=329112 RepID=UPI002479CD29|nr:succinate dehydrogenase cytochrome b560 subunit, mitochondrial-like [Toxorhynchites rutilus septentrionalis]